MSWGRNFIGGVKSVIQMGEAEVKRIVGLR